MSMAANFPMLFSMEKRWGSLALGFWKKGFGPGRKGASKAIPGMVAGRAGNQSLVDAIAEELSRKGVRIRLSASVAAIRKTATRRPALSFGDSSESMAYDGVIACIPPRETARLYGEAGPEVRRFLEGIPYASVALGYLAYRKRDLGKGFGGMGCLVQGRTGLGILSLFMPSRMFPGRCPDDEELVRIMVGGMRSEAAARLGDGELNRLSASAASRVLETKASPIDFTCIRHQSVLPQIETGHPEAFAKATASLEAEIPGLILAGTGYAGAGIENAVKEGKRAAEELLMRMSTIV
jgi:protoporphyrinogen/coproporphyrinogen III oxidase